MTIAKKTHKRDVSPEIWAKNTLPSALNGNNWEGGVFFHRLTDETYYLSDETVNHLL